MSMLKKVSKKTAPKQARQNGFKKLKEVKPRIILDEECQVLLVLAKMAPALVYEKDDNKWCGLEHPNKIEGQVNKCSRKMGHDGPHLAMDVKMLEPCQNEPNPWR